MELPGELKDEIAAIIEELKKAYPHRLKWVKRENLHITLQFIGDVPAGRVDKLSADFGSMMSDQSAIEIFNPKLEAIPPKDPRLIWLHYDYNCTGLERVVNGIRDYLTKNNFKIDKKPFKMHVTLGRVKKRLSSTEKIEQSKKVLEERKWIVREAVFYESRLFPEGPEYRKIEVYPLKEEKTGR